MKVMTVAALKGGIGKTTIAVGLAQAMAARGVKVGLLDLDYRNPEVLVALNTTNGEAGRTMGPESGEGNSDTPMEPSSVC